MYASILRMALEELSDGKLHNETELVYYAKISNFDQFKDASHMEHHEQWSILVAKTPGNNNNQGTLRVRKTVTQDKEEYVLTAKAETPVKGVRMEVSTPTSLDLFEVFKRLSDAGMKKNRFEFPIPGTDLKWEVDLYINNVVGETATFHAWCKIDLEVPDMNYPVPNFPIEFDELLNGNYNKQTPEEREKIKHLYDTVFISKNECL